METLTSPLVRLEVIRRRSETGFRISATYRAQIKLRPDAEAGCNDGGEKQLTAIQDRAWPPVLAARLFPYLRTLPF